MRQAAPDKNNADFVLIRVQFENGLIVLTEDRHGNYRLPGGHVQTNRTPRNQCQLYIQSLLDLKVEQNAIVEVKGGLQRGSQQGKRHSFRVNLGEAAYEHCCKVATYKKYVRVVSRSEAAKRLSGSDFNAVF